MKSKKFKPLRKVAPPSKRHKTIGKTLLDGLIANERGNYDAEDVINVLLKVSGGAAGKRIRSRRDELHMPQGDLAAALESSQSEIAKIESGQRAISVEDAKILAEHLKVSPEWILTGK
jgi:ribosome-binding protein aMBF1 (putative translation factor)